MLCHQVTLSGEAEWPKVADAVIEAQRQAILRGLERCEKQYEALQERRRENEEMDFLNEPPPPRPARSGPRRNIAQDD